MKNIILTLLLLTLFSLNSYSNETTMSKNTPIIERNNPAGVFDSTNKFSQAVRVKSGDLLFISGQVAFDEEGNIIGKGDLRKQARKAYENLKTILHSYNADFNQVIKLNIYIVNYKSEYLPIFHEIQSQYLNPEHLPASTLLGVQALARPELLIEIEAIAVVKNMPD